MIVLLSSRYLASKLLCTERRERIKGRKSLKPFPSEAIDWGSAWTPRYRWQIATRPETLITHTRGGRQSLAHFDTIGKQQLLKAKGNINLISSGETCQQVEIVIDSSPFLVYSGTLTGDQIINKSDVVGSINFRIALVSFPMPSLEDNTVFQVTRHLRFANSFPAAIIFSWAANSKISRHVLPLTIAY